MLQFRIKILERVMGAESPDQIESTLFQTIQQYIRAGASAKRIMQVIPVLESDMLFQLRLDHSAQELANIKEALRVFRQGIQPDLICFNG